MCCSTWPAQPSAWLSPQPAVWCASVEPLSPWWVSVSPQHHRLSVGWSVAVKIKITNLLNLLLADWMYKLLHYGATMLQKWEREKKRIYTCTQPPPQSGITWFFAFNRLKSSSNSLLSACREPFFSDSTDREWCRGLMSDWSFVIWWDTMLGVLKLAACLTPDSLYLYHFSWCAPFDFCNLALCKARLKTQVYDRVGFLLPF